MPGGGGQQQVQSNEPWRLAAPFLTGIDKEGWYSDTVPDLKGLYPEAANLFSQGPTPYYPGQTYLDPNRYQSAAISGLGRYGGQLAGMQDPMFDALGSQLSGYNQAMGAYSPYLGQSAGTYGNVMGRQSYGDVWGAMGDTEATRALSGMYNQTGNPYLNDMIRQGQTQMADVFNEQVMQNIRDEGILTGQYGGSNMGQAVDVGTRNLLQQMSDYDASMRGAQYQADMNRGLQAATTGAGFEAAAGRTGISANQALDAARLQAAGGLGNLYQGGLNIGTDAASRALALAPTTYAAGALPYEMMGQAGAQQAGFEQQALDEAMARHYYPQQSQMDMMNWYGSLMQGSPYSTSIGSVDTGYNNITGALGGGLMGYGMANAGMLGPWMAANPWVGAGALGLSMIDW